MNKIHIEKNSVQETLIVPLFGRKMCAEKFPELYADTSAKAFCEKLDYDFSELEKKQDTFFYEFGALEAAMRQLDMMWEIKNYLKKHPNATVVNLGCGLDQTGLACDNGTCHIVNIDFPDIIKIRNLWKPVHEREENIAADIRNDSWVDQIDGSRGIILFASGVFHYFKTEEVKALVLRLSQHYPNGCLIFDTVGKAGLRLMMSKTLKNMGIQDVKGYFCVSDPLKELNWSDTINVSSKGYMLGYYDMKSPGIHPSHRLLARLGDRMMKMSIIKMEF